MLFYTPLIRPDHRQFFLDEDESKHAVRVLRLGEGDEVQLVDGRGGWYQARILDPRPKGVTLDILSVQEHVGQSPYHLHLAVAPTKNIDRFEWFLEKATEIGVQEVTPLICDHSERKEVKLERLEKVAVSAMKQSQKAYLPHIHPATKMSAFLKALSSEPATDIAAAERRYIAHCGPGEKLFMNEQLDKLASSGLVDAKPRILVLIGPEGDFSPAEIEAAQQPHLGFQAISLGHARLRTETAAVAACLEVSLCFRA